MIIDKWIYINKWYNCQIGDDLELCKIVRRFKDMGNNGVLSYWVVTTWYTAKDIHRGNLGSCKKFIEERYIYG